MLFIFENKYYSSVFVQCQLWLLYGKLIDDFEYFKPTHSVRWEEPVTARLSDDMTVHSAALPGSGILVNFILQLLDGFLQFAYSDINRSQLIIEAFKHAFGRRTDLGDPYFLNKTTLNKVLFQCICNCNSLLFVARVLYVFFMVEKQN